MTTDVTALKTEVAGLVSDQAAFNAKVDADLLAISEQITALKTVNGGPTQADLDALQAQVASVRAGLATEAAKVDVVAGTPAPVPTPAPAPAA